MDALQRIASLATKNCITATSMLAESAARINAAAARVYHLLARSSITINWQSAIRAYSSAAAAIYRAKGACPVMFFSR
jgi:hypothetical protein